MGLEALGKRGLHAGPDVSFVDTRWGRVRIRERRAPGKPGLLFGVDAPNVVEHYDGLLAALDGKADVVVVEPPGTGGSLPGTFDFTMASFVQLFTTVRAALGLERAALVMPCYLGFVGQHLGARLVQVQTPSWEDMQRWVRRVDPRGLVRTPLVGQLMVRLLETRIVRGWYSASAGDRASGQRLTSTATAVLASGGCYCLASVMQGLARGAPPPGPSTAANAWGDMDRTHRRSTVPAGARVFHGAGHSPELEQPEAFAAWLVEEGARHA